MSFTDSYTKTFIKRLLKNKGAMFGLVVISVSFVIAFFAYFIAPDHTPNANQMTIEIGGKKPGFTMQFLKVRNAQTEKISFIQGF